MSRPGRQPRRRPSPPGPNLNPNPYLGLPAPALAHAAADLADELRQPRRRTPDERFDLANRCIHMLGACAFVIHHEHALPEASPEAMVP